VSPLELSLLFTLALAILVIALAPERFGARLNLAGLAERRRGPMERFAEALDAAGLYNKAPTFMATALAGSALVAAGIGGLIFGIIGLLAAPVIVLLGFKIWLERRQRQFLSRVLSDLPGFLNTMQAKVRGGGTTRDGYIAAIEQSRYLRRYLGPSLGLLRTNAMPFSDVLTETLPVLPIRAWEMFINQLILFNETGGAIADSLAETVAQINTIIDMQAQGRAKTAAPRQQQKLIIAIVFGFLFIFQKISGMSPLTLFTKPLGWVFLVVGGGMIFGGIRIGATRMRAIERRLSQ
jgi:Flp pilus assembly protein TadB